MERIGELRARQESLAVDLRGEQNLQQNSSVAEGGHGGEGVGGRRLTFIAAA